MADILARIDQALTQCPGCKRHVDDDPRILSLYGRCYDCKFKLAGETAKAQIADTRIPRCPAVNDDRRCERPVGHEDHHMTRFAMWPREVMPTAPLEPDPDEPCGPGGVALTCVTTVDDHRCVREIRHDGRHWFHVPHLDGEPAEPAAAEHRPDAAGPTEAPEGSDGAAAGTAPQLTAEHVAEHYGVPVEMIGNGAVSIGPFDVRSGPFIIIEPDLPWWRRLLRRWIP